jgi:hypothetical protein
MSETQGRFCTSCGTRLHGTSFCTACGTPVAAPDGELDANASTIVRLEKRSGGPATSAGSSWGSAPPEGRHTDAAPAGERRSAVAMALVGSMIVLAIGGTAFGVVAWRDEDAPPDPAAARDGSPPATTEPADPAPTTLQTPSPSEPPLAPDDAVNLDAGQAAGLLDEAVERNRAAVTALAGSWVPQVSSKCPGLTVDLGPGFAPDGVPDTDSVTPAQILGLHLALAERYGAITTTAADLGSRSVPARCAGQQLWVSLVPSRYSSSDGPLAWCSDHGFPAGECGARAVMAPGEPGTQLVLPGDGG